MNLLFQNRAVGLSRARFARDNPFFLNILLNIKKAGEVWKSEKNN